MPVYRESGGSIIYDVVKVQTCSGQPLEVITASGQTVYLQQQVLQLVMLLVVHVYQNH